MSRRAAPTIDLTVEGTHERAWSEVLDRLPPFEWPDVSRVVVVSPHPDDETLGAGGLIAAASDMGFAVDVFCVTDGEAAFEHRDLGTLRRREFADALEHLAPTATIGRHHLGFPDGHVTASEDALRCRLGDGIAPDDLVLCPLPNDGHPDHDATARAATEAAAAAGAALRWFPVWAWHWYDPNDSQIGHGRRLELMPAVRARKRAAIDCYRSQLGGLDPVVPASMLRRLDRPFEVYVTPTVTTR